MSSSSSLNHSDIPSTDERSKSPRRTGKLNKLAISMHERLRVLLHRPSDDKPKTGGTSLSNVDTTFEQGTNPEDHALAPTLSRPFAGSESSHKSTNNFVSAQVADHGGYRNPSQRSVLVPSETSEIPSFQQYIPASMFSGARGFAIGGNASIHNVGKQNVYNQYGGGPSNLDILQPFVSFDAFHDSSAQDPHRQCHPGTRENVLKQMSDWIDNPDPSAPRMLWLHGPAGVGKSAIAQSISKSYGPGKVAATFFFFRSDPNRNDGNRLFPTLAWRLAKSIPRARECIADALSKDWDIPRKGVEDQFEQLICQPLLSVSGSTPHVKVIIIDGVDECANEKLQQRILETIGKAIAGNRTPLRFLVCSRPETLIKDTLDEFQSAVLHIDLATLDDAYQDIEKYLRSEFSRIASRQDIPPLTWPDEDVIRELVSKSSGQFVYASTVIKFVGDEYSTATSQLDIILGLKPIDDDKSPFSELDTLYLEILQRQREQRFLKGFFALFVAGCQDEDYGLLLDTTKNGVLRKLRGMHSIFKFTPKIDVHHRSFLDFLEEESRSRQYHTGRQAATRRYLELIVEVLIRFANRAIKQPDYHENEHFAPRFGEVIKEYSLNIDVELPLKDFEEVLSPLSRTKEESLKFPNPSSPWKRGLCDQCIFFLIIDDLLLHLAYRRATPRAVAPCFQLEFEHTGASPLIPVGEGHEDLNSYLSLLLPLLRNEQDWESGTSIDLLRALLQFEPSKTALKLQSIPDAQNLIDVICHMTRNEHLRYQRGCGPHTAWNGQDATNLTLEIYARIPLIPQLFLDGTAVINRDDIGSMGEYQGRGVGIWGCNHYGINALCQRACIWGTLSHSNISPLLGILEESNIFSFVFPLTEHGTLKEWQQRAKPSVIEIQERILEVAKAIEYMHSLGLVLDFPIYRDTIFLDSNCHAQVPGLCLSLRYCREASPEYRDFGNDAEGMCTYESGVLTFGCVFYEIYFDIDISDPERRGLSDEQKTANRPDEPEIDENAWELIQRCCAADPKTRPTMDQVVKEMESWKLA